MNASPKGLKGAPSYFQGELASTVLRGLLYDICELYIDDVIVFGNSKKEFLANIELVFNRLLKHRLTVNPEKCLIGMLEVEFVGHTIDERAMSFSREKNRQGVKYTRTRSWEGTELVPGGSWLFPQTYK